MTKNRLIDQIWCLDQNTDTLELVGSIRFNTVVLDLKAENDNYVTHVMINQKMAQQLSESLRKWVEGEKL